MLTVQAPAKLNLTLEVLGERTDGFHEIRSVIQTVDLCDSLHLYPGRSVELRSDTPGWIPEESLVSKAIDLFQKTTGCTKGVTIEISKRIPWLSGLGGDSSDAAAILRGLNELWELGLSLDELLELAAQLSSDVSFFLFGGTALVEGRGEKVTSLPPLPHMWIVLMIPPVIRRLGKTKQLYNSLKAIHYTGGEITDRLVKLLARGEEIVPAYLFNVFDEVIHDNFDGIDRYRGQFLESGDQKVHLAGSGPTLFTLVKDKKSAEGTYQDLRKQGLESYWSDTLPSV